MEKAQSPWSVPVTVEEIPDTGLHIEIEAPADVRAQLAKFAGVRDLPKLSIIVDLMRRGTGVHASGQVNARVGQTCVVTLDPMESDLNEPVNLVFSPKTSDVTSESAESSDQDEPPEPLVGGKIDLGAIATEFLLLGVDPYPRKTGAEFAAVKADDTARPFAALEALKKRLGG
jgi:uncharacterized metal-binding protein YceD (DUF177 family)